MIGCILALPRSAGFPNLLYRSASSLRRVEKSKIIALERRQPAGSRRHSRLEVCATR
jgi:hypothetical protein